MTRTQEEFHAFFESIRRQIPGSLMVGGGGPTDSPDGVRQLQVSFHDEGKTKRLDLHASIIDGQPRIQARFFEGPEGDVPPEDWS